MNRIFNRLGHIIENKYKWVLVIAGLLVVSAIVGAVTGIKMDSGMGTMLPADNQAMIDFERFTDSFGNEQVVILLSADSSDDLLKQSNLEAMESIQSDINDNADLEDVSAIGPTFLLKQAITKMEEWDALPPDQRPITLPDTLPTWPPSINMIEDIMAISLFGEGLGQMIVDNTEIEGKAEKVHALIVVSSNTDFISKNVKTVGAALEKAVDDSGFGSDEPVIVGGPLIMDEVEVMMAETMPIMLGLAVILLFVLLAVIFKVRGFFAWRWLPLGVVLIGLIYTFGVMGLLSIPLTMVSMAVFPVMLGLGIDYGIQLHNRYDEDSIDKSPAQAIIHAVTHMGPAVGIALIASCLGLAAMFFSPMMMVRDFGLMLMIGMIASYVVAVFPLPVILYWHHRKKSNNGNGKAKASPLKVNSHKMGFLEKGLHRIAPWIIKSPKIILPIALILAAGGMVADYYMEVSFDETEFLSESSPVMQKINKLVEVDQGLVLFNILVEGDDLASPETMDWITGVKQSIIDGNAASDEYMQYADEVNTIADTVKQANNGIMPSTAEKIRTVLGKIPPVQKANLIVLGDDGVSYTAANIMVSVTDWDIDIVPGFRDKLVEYTADSPTGVSVAVTGQPILDSEIMSAMTNSRSKITLFSILFIFAGLFLMFRFNILKAIVATLPVVLIVGWSALTMYVLGMNYTPLTAALGAMAIAIGVEFTILLMSRYYEERAKGQAPAEAMTMAMTKIGRAIAASALTTIGGFAALLFAFDFLILQDFGVITMINVFFALAVTIFVLPSLVVIMDKWKMRRKQARIE